MIRPIGPKLARPSPSKDLSAEGSGKLPLGSGQGGTVQEPLIGLALTVFVLLVSRVLVDAWAGHWRSPGLNG